MEISRTRPESQRGPAERFTGEVWFDVPAYWGEPVSDEEYLADPA